MKIETWQCGCGAYWEYCTPLAAAPVCERCGGTAVKRPLPWEAPDPDQPQSEGLNRIMKKAAADTLADTLAVLRAAPGAYAALERAVSDIATDTADASRILPAPRAMSNVFRRAPLPSEVKHEHLFRVDDANDVLSCACGTVVSNEALLANGFVRLDLARERYDRVHQALADEAQTLRDSNTELLAENARLRRQAERGKR